jgi:hypothetical protein
MKPIDDIDPERIKLIGKASHDAALAAMQILVERVSSDEAIAATVATCASMCFALMSMGASKSLVEESLHKALDGMYRAYPDKVRTP